MLLKEKANKKVQILTISNTKIKQEMLGLSF